MWPCREYSEVSGAVKAEAVSQFFSLPQEISEAQFHDCPTSREGKRESGDRESGEPSRGQIMKGPPGPIKDLGFILRVVGHLSMILFWESEWLDLHARGSLSP